VRFETIAACITALPGPVAVVRVSGSGAWAAAQAVSGYWPDEAQAQHVFHTVYSTQEDGLVTLFAAGHSFTGEESAELSLHGSHPSVVALLESLYERGVKPAEPGEFTQRAFVNGRLDLTQAEAVLDTVNAATQAQAREAHKMRLGVLYRQVSALRDLLVGVLAMVEASTDFGEEVGAVDISLAVARLYEVRDGIDRLLVTRQAGHIIRNGLRIAILGKPNAGKSSLLNALLGRDRAIVTAVPGTTRDTLEEPVDLGGVPCMLIDTAGLRETQDEVEAMGVGRSHDAAASANLVWYVYDAAVGYHGESPADAFLIANKADLNPAPSHGLAVSALTGEGLGALIETISSRLPEIREHEAVINRRHAPLLDQAQAAVESVVATLRSDVPDDLAAVGLQQAIRLLGEVTGETTPPDVIDRIFHDFCIGK
jgi:tRNA modification GTPase